MQRGMSALNSAKSFRQAKRAVPQPQNKANPKHGLGQRFFAATTNSDTLSFTTAYRGVRRPGVIYNKGDAAFETQCPPSAQEQILTAASAPPVKLLTAATAPTESCAQLSQSCSVQERSCWTLKRNMGISPRDGLQCG